ncbi:MAG: FMN-binding protein [Oscillospiraceae bacterium]
MRKGLKILLIVIAVLAALVITAFLLMKNTADKALANIVFEDIDMAQAQNGTYYGETDAGMVYVKVAVTVENHGIKDIDIVEHRNGRGAKAEAITDTMIKDNSYNVDDVSGATLSSRAIKSAVSKALKQSCS